jgi:class 3 adenylate cyclase
MPTVEQRKSILNLYNSGITPDIIALEMDLSQDDIMNIIKESAVNEDSGTTATSARLKSDKRPNMPLISSLYLDTVVNIDLAIKQAQRRVWQVLKIGSNFDISMEETQNILQSFAGSKGTFVILHIDLVESTKLSMILPVDSLTTIIRAFTQEMSMMIAAYGGYVLKYVGDAILAFFVVTEHDKEKEQENNVYLPCINAVNAACSMIRVVCNGINPILNQYDYPELQVRIGVDVGESAVVQYGWDTHSKNGKVVMKEAHLDVLGYTVNIAAKMTSMAKPDHIVIGQMVYDLLDEKLKREFRLLPISTEMWNYVSNYTDGKIYNLYESKT